MKKLVSLFLSLMLASSTLIGCSSNTAETNAGSLSPITVENFNHQTTYTEVPQRVVVLSYDVAEIMVALGLQDSIVGLAPAENALEDVLPQYQETIGKIPLLDCINGDVPNLESVLQVNPDFVYATAYSFQPQNAGSPEDYEKNGVNIYASEGTYLETCTLENTYNDILHIGQIFRIEEKAHKLIDELKKQVAMTEDKTKNLNPLKVFVYDSGEDKPFTVGGSTLESNLIQLAGGQNIFDDLNKQFIDTTWEDLIDRNPDVIVIHKWDANDDATQKITFLKSKKELSEVSAIKNDRFIIIPLLSVFPSLQNINALETLAKGFHPDTF